MNRRALSQVHKGRANIVGSKVLYTGFGQNVMSTYTSGAPGGDRYAKFKPINNAPAVAPLNVTFPTYVDGFPYSA